MKKIVIVSIVSLFVFSCKDVARDANPQENYEVEAIVETNDTRLDEINQLILDNPNSEIGYYQLAQYHLDNNNPEQALKQINRAMKIAPKDANINYVKAMAYLGINKIEQGLPFLERTLELDSTHTDGMLELAYYYLAGKNYEPSLDLINKAITQNMYMARPYYLKGMWYEQQAQNKLAISSYQTAIERDPNYYNAYLALGSIHNKMDDPLAIQYFNSAIATWPESIEAWRLKGMSYYDHNQYEEAIVCFDTILYFDSTFEVSYFDIGRTLINLCYDDNPKEKNDSLLDLAINYFDKALNLNVNYVPAKYNRALCYETKGNKQLAKSEYKEILKLETNYEPAIDALNRFDNK
ncbi:MAG: tetratricopeptide repeat protein [Flavobacteriales bacterium]